MHGQPTAIRGGQDPDHLAERALSCNGWKFYDSDASAPPRPEMHPDYIDMMFTYIDNNENRDRNGNVMIRKEHLTKLGVTVGDVMTLRLSR